ncbi:hypothetical protein LOTGIDRAFT_226955 [Lottia gigantea]|uniref:28S ribosomal protein S14, mitochondrial n=1 Tax=Lottia gigantea TaxID=225164 RepID=V4ASA4_LOTGI|nr:hypothetical protein LOTGIDRAFT_226955 [Lottia gigantea]ESO96611.1 hypothetical protein LOTGIDRAFT_226955 [Lottia gigantea]
MWNQLNKLLRPVYQMVTPVRNQHYDCRTWRDMKRRKIVQKTFPVRQRLNSLRKNGIIPKELQEIADKEIKQMELNTCQSRLWPRCVLTSRPRGLMDKWRVSRIVWRDQVDYNRMSGLKRSCW